MTKRRAGEDLYLVQRHSIRLAPSLAVARTAAAAVASPGPAVVVGGPEHREYDALPAAVDEANSVVRLLGAASCSLHHTPLPPPLSALDFVFHSLSYP
jgi:CHAT domain-containing protein